VQAAAMSLCYVSTQHIYTRPIGLTHASKSLTLLLCQLRTPLPPCPTDFSQGFEALRAHKYAASFRGGGINGRCLLGITSEADAESLGIVFRYAVQMAHELYIVTACYTFSTYTWMVQVAPTAAACSASPARPTLRAWASSSGARYKWHTSSI
jgi:hypothetical protein